MERPPIWLKRGGDAAFMPQSAREIVVGRGAQPEAVRPRRSQSVKSAQAPLVRQPASGDRVARARQPRGVPREEPREAPQRAARAAASPPRTASTTSGAGGRPSPWRARSSGGVDDRAVGRGGDGLRRAGRLGTGPSRPARARRRAARSARAAPPRAGLRRGRRAPRSSAPAPASCSPLRARSSSASSSACGKSGAYCSMSFGTWPLAARRSASRVLARGDAPVLLVVGEDLVERVRVGGRRRGEDPCERREHECTAEHDSAGS